MRWESPRARSSQRKLKWVSVMVDRWFVLGAEEKEKFRTLLRIYEKFSGCRVTVYCLRDDHFHLLLEVPQRSVGGFSDEELLVRLREIYDEAFVAAVSQELAEARKQVTDRLAEAAVVVGRIHARFTDRMHDLGEFMKGVLQRYTQWRNRMHSRIGRLWKNRFKNVIREDGVSSD